MTNTIVPLTMPKFGLAMTEGKLASWLVEPGQSVKQGDELADIETSKITSGYESPTAGVLRKQVAPAGETLPVGALIGVLADPAVSDADIEAFVTRFQAEQSTGEEAEGANSADTEPHQVQAGEYSLNVRDVGNGDDLPLLLIHGFGGDISNWLLTQDALASGRRVIAFDLPGHGASTKAVKDGSLVGLARAVGDLLEALSIPKAHVMGHSLGGGIALTLLREHSDKVASLSLLAPAGLEKAVNMAFITGFIEADRNRAMQQELEKLVHDKSLIGRKMVDSVMRARRLDGARDALRTIAAACFPNGEQGDDLRPVLDEAKVPVQLFWGEADEVLPVAGADNVPSSVKKHILPGVGHLPQLEKASEVNKETEEFLKERVPA
ncbi:acetoin dehydrogenase dihydrolipoyllysine-residue acetyltransferase subunit [Acetobacter senegalensis]|uniref:acetoin dehydrogenase dihydrolipoyllysine-residue acetyltransferase subunit n=1 Tax=Acetobacter senegalensis TaxID=446692 RepID=UPI001EDB82DD|nr:acetoin dehydrogenase dihydrolipoyllysine-residue acetyltransferase subunit [Acetobacter senegalensis]MCG4260212.1 acetoin dehydrogenase dihydrolipoyllysine-residue acetyltransferase subunit [Acetobacter senegalensis]